MSDFERDDPLTRRHFIQGTAMLVTSVCLLGCDAEGQEASRPMQKALDDPGISHGKVSFRSGSGSIDGYLSRPKKPGRFPMVLVITGSSIRDEYIANTTAMLAQAGFVGLAPDIFSLQTDAMSAEEKRQVFATKITDQRIFQDIRAGLRYLEGQRFVKRGPIGITGFCFGGRCALMFAAESKEVGAVVPFYGNLRTPPSAGRTLDPLDVMKRIKAPVQGHYVRNDSGIPLLQLEEFEQTLRAQGTPVEMFLYDVEHGFFAFYRSVYNAEAAALAWSRAAGFFKRHLS